MAPSTFLTGVLMCCAAAAQEESSDPLCRAAQYGDLTQVKILLSRGADPSVRDQQGETPLMKASSSHMRYLPDSARKVERDYQGVVKLLLDKGADVNARDDTGRTALSMAVDGSASEYRVIGADEAIARLLIARGADVNAQDELGWSPLLRLLDLWADLPALMDFLVSKGADVNARVKDGRSGLMLATRLGKSERITFLIAKGADVNARDQTGATTLMIAAAVRWEEQSVKILKALISNGANLNITDNNGRTAADRAAEAGYIDRAKFLIASGTRITDLPGFLKRAQSYALWHAIAGGEVSVAKTLLEQGTNPNFRGDLERRC